MEDLGGLQKSYTRLVIKWTIHSFKFEHSMSTLWHLVYCLPWAHGSPKFSGPRYEVGAFAKGFAKRSMHRTFVRPIMLKRKRRMQPRQTLGIKRLCSSPASTCCGSEELKPQAAQPASVLRLEQSKSFHGDSTKSTYHPSVLPVIAALSASCNGISFTLV